MKDLCAQKQAISVRNYYKSTALLPSCPWWLAAAARQRSRARPVGTAGIGGSSGREGRACVGGSGVQVRWRRGAAGVAGPPQHLARGRCVQLQLNLLFLRLLLLLLLPPAHAAAAAAAAASPPPLVQQRLARARHERRRRGRQAQVALEAGQQRRLGKEPRALDVHGSGGRGRGLGRLSPRLGLGGRCCSCRRRRGRCRRSRRRSRLGRGRRRLGEFPHLGRERLVQQRRGCSCRLKVRWWRRQRERGRGDGSSSDGRGRGRRQQRRQGRWRRRRRGDRGGGRGGGDGLAPATAPRPPLLGKGPPPCATAAAAAAASARSRAARSSSRRSRSRSSARSRSARARASATCSARSAA